MSRIGKQSIQLPPGVTVRLEAGQLLVKGPKGELGRAWPRTLTLTVAAGEVKTDLAAGRGEIAGLGALWGTYTAHLKNMVLGVTAGFEKRLIIEGIGYKALLNADTLTLQVGFSHPVVVSIPKELKLTLDKNLITVSGADREAVGQFAARLRAVRPPDPYKEKGLRYATEKVIRKQSHKVVAAA